MPNKKQLEAGVKIIIELARAVCDTYKLTAMPVPLGPLYATLMPTGMTLAHFQRVTESLSNSGFIVTQETIEPGPELKAALLN